MAVDEQLCLSIHESNAQVIRLSECTTSTDFIFMTWENGRYTNVASNPGVQGWSELNNREFCGPYYINPGYTMNVHTV